MMPFIVAETLSKSAFVFVGLPASGKSAVGRMLSHKLGIPFFDLDEIIEKKYQVSIQDLFKHKKEAYFRVLESQCLDQLYKRPKPSAYIISTGGGAVQEEKNRALIRKLGHVIYLKASLDTIVERLQSNDHPICFKRSPGDMKNLLNERAKYYMNSDWTIETGGKSDHQVFLEILRRIKDGARRQKENT